MPAFPKRQQRLQKTWAGHIAIASQALIAQSQAQGQLNNATYAFIAPTYPEQALLAPKPGSIWKIGKVSCPLAYLASITPPSVFIASGDTPPPYAGSSVDLEISFSLDGGYTAQQGFVQNIGFGDLPSNVGAISVSAFASPGGDLTNPLIVTDRDTLALVVSCTLHAGVGATNVGFFCGSNFTQVINQPGASVGSQPGRIAYEIEMV